MSHFYATAKIKKNDGVDFKILRKEIKKLAECSEAEKGCVRFECREIINEQGSFLLWEEFLTEEDLEAHFKYEHTINFLSLNLTTIQWEYFCEG